MDASSTNGKKKTRLWISAGCAAAVTAILFVVDLVRLSSQDTEDNLRLSRQIVSQIESLNQTFTEQNKSDPLSFAVKTMAEGTEPRIIRISKSEQRKMNQPSESYMADRKEGVFEYAKVFSPDKDVVIHVEIHRGYRGFLGSRSRFSSDALAFFVFSGIFSILYLLVLVSEKPRDSSQIKTRVVQWTTSARDLLLQLGGQIKSTVTHAQALINAANKSFEAIQGLRLRVHSRLKTLHDSRKSLNELKRLSMEIESLGLRITAETRKPQIDARLMSELTRDFNKTIGAFRTTRDVVFKEMEQIEVDLEPWSVDLDMAFHAFDSIVDVTAKLNQDIRETKTHVMKQAKTIQDLKTDVAS